jgi:hypothetical protein
MVTVRLHRLRRISWRQFDDRSPFMTNDMRPDAVFCRTRINVDEDAARAANCQSDSLSTHFSAIALPAITLPGGSTPVPLSRRALRFAVASSRPAGFSCCFASPERFRWARYCL